MQISATVGHNSRTLQGNLVELPVQTPLAQTAGEHANIDFTPQPIQANQVFFGFFFLHPRGKFLSALLGILLKAGLQIGSY